MKRTHRYLMLFLSIVFMYACGPGPVETTPIPDDPDIVISPHVPTAITVTTKPPTLESLQHDFDVFSWQSFIALNWPANDDGTPKDSITFGADQSGPTVWQSWKSSREIFLPNGEKPNAWGQVENIPIVCDSIDPELLKKGVIKLTHINKSHNANVLDESGEPFQTGPLIDQNGNYTRYEILTNKVMFDYIVDNTLYNQEGQAAFGKDADFPFSQPDSIKSKDKEGAIMVKAAWIVMDGKYDASKFHTTYALVYDNPHEQAGVKPACKLQKVGLVGFHIAHKTKGDPQWIWSTFEHVANAPTQGEPVDRDFYNFYNAESKAAVNTPPARPWNPANTDTPPTQVERVIAIDDDAKALNTKYQAALEKLYKGSVWANYELISTQWPTDPNSVSDLTGRPAPTFLANATLETYIQGSVPQTSSNCIACHNNADMTNGMFSDFTYLLQRANKQKK